MSLIMIALMTPFAENPYLSQNAQTLELMSRTARNSFSLLIVVMRIPRCVLKISYRSSGPGPMVQAP